MFLYQKVKLMRRIVMFIVFLVLSSSPSFAYKLGLTVSVKGQNEIDASWNSFSGKTFYVTYKKSSSSTWEPEAECKGCNSSGGRDGAFFKNLDCGTQYDVKVMRSGFWWHHKSATTSACVINAATACPKGGWFDGANCQIGKAPSGTTAFIYANNYYYTALAGNSCPYAGSYYDGANCFVSSVPSGVKPFIYANNWYYEHF
jgi:hypothetical protein